MQDVMTLSEDQQTGHVRTAEAQAEVFWWAFQALPQDAQWAIRERLLAQTETFSPTLAMELESWQVAGREALQTFEAMLDEA